MDTPKRKFGIVLSAGFITAITLIGIHSVFSFITYGEFFFWLIKIFAYFLVGRLVAQKQFELQKDLLEPEKGIRYTGISAAITTSLLMWMFFILRSILDVSGIYRYLTIFLGIIFDLPLAISLGAYGARIAEKYIYNLSGDSTTDAPPPAGDVKNKKRKEK